MFRIILLIILQTCFCSTTVLNPLFLTTLTNKGDSINIQNISRVHLNQFSEIESYTGFVTVNEKFKSNLFFWFFKSKNKSAPLLIWLQGGPGYSSLFGLFVENGPFEVTKEFKLKKRKYSWTKGYSMIYFDFPIGVGFSFTEHEYGYCKHNEQNIDE
ncbi:uncharacterized protein B4U80_04706 [Leptotrombidium deliense]|uniref:Serine carboxypeptidase CPVL-like protein n=1 Tax=Leptotrombidium deliense TaxID=299467 RepID=A0A443RZF7_9ACAR|nr:uncharacterized protein B4U80_04706 [Leptotrombidium deliense]